LPRLVGLAQAKEIALFGGMWSGVEAAEIGLVNRAMPAAELDAFVDDWATTLAAGPPLALSMTKTLLHASSTASMEQAVEDEARCQALNFSTEDTNEALAAFVEKRDPIFIGR
jgi:enoyl-CoA hydratase/carnithine racemase